MTPEQARDEALATVEAGADPQWMIEAGEVMARLARENAEVTSDYLWDAGLPTPREPRAIGAIFTQSKSKGLIEPTGFYVTSTRPERNMGTVQVWRSKICSSEVAEAAEAKNQAWKATHGATVVKLLVESPDIYKLLQVAKLVGYEP